MVILGTKKADAIQEDEEPLLTPRPSPEAEESREPRRRPNVVTLSGAPAAAAPGALGRHQSVTVPAPTMTNEMISAIARRLSRQCNDKDPTTYNSDTLHNTVCTIVSHSASLMKAAEECGGMRLKSLAVAVIPSSNPNTKTKKPQLASTLANIWSFLSTLLQYKDNRLSLRVERALSSTIGMLEKTHRHCLMEEEAANMPANMDKLLKGVRLTAAQLSR